MKLKIKHHSLFQNLKAETIYWDQLRNDSEEEHYYIPCDKNEFVNVCNQNKNQFLIDNLTEVLRNRNINKLLSLGSGRSCLEYFLTQQNFKVSISDIFGPINRLKSFNLFENVYEMNFFDSMEQIKESKTAVLLGRIDTELNDQMLCELFKQLYSRKVKNVIFIPAQLLTIKSLLIEFYLRLKARFFKRKLVFCGYSRSFSLFESLWKKFYNSQKFCGFYLLKIK